jgi:hypothetical protein
VQGTRSPSVQPSGCANASRLKVVPQAAGCRSGTQFAVRSSEGTCDAAHSIPAQVPALMRWHSRLQVPNEPVQARRNILARMFIFAKSLGNCQYNGS